MGSLPWVPHVVLAYCGAKIVRNYSGPAQPSPAQPASQPALQLEALGGLLFLYSWEMGRQIANPSALQSNRRKSDGSTNCRPISKPFSKFSPAPVSPVRVHRNISYASASASQRQFRQCECVATPVSRQFECVATLVSPVRVRRNASFASSSASQRQLCQCECVATPVMLVRVRRNASDCRVQVRKTPRSPSARSAPPRARTRASRAPPSPGPPSRFSRGLPGFPGWASLGPEPVWRRAPWESLYILL